MKIRKATGEEMLRLWGYPDGNEATPTAKYFYQNIASGNALFWTVEEDGELIGELYAFLDIPEDRDFADGETTAYLCAFRINKAYRGRGLGSRLMEAVLADLKARGFRRVTIGVSEERNERLYRRMGFTEKIKDCDMDPCARDADMQPEADPAGYRLLAKELSPVSGKKLVFIEGVSGVGKTTLARNLAARLREQGRTVRAWVEFDHTNPIDFYCTAALRRAELEALARRFQAQREKLERNAIPAGDWRLVRYYYGDDPAYPEPLLSELAARELCYHPKDPVPPAVYSEIYEAVWRGFARDPAAYPEEFLLFDGALLHHPINDMLRNYGVSAEAAAAHVERLLAALGPVPRQVLYLQTDDLPAQLARAHAQRGEAAPTGEELTFWQTRRAYDEAVLAGLSEPVVRLDPAQGWESMTEGAAAAILAAGGG